MLRKKTKKRMLKFQTLEEAKKKLKKINLDLEIENEKDIVNTDIITRQIPKSGIKVKEGTKIMANV